MAEVLASAMTGSVNSLDVKGLKLKDGPPHDLGQFYMLLDPQTYSGDVFWDRIERLADAVNEQENARLPGANRTLPDAVSIDDALWDKVLKLAGTA